MQLKKHGLLALISLAITVTVSLIGCDSDDDPAPVEPPPELRVNVQAAIAAGTAFVRCEDQSTVTGGSITGVTFTLRDPDGFTVTTGEVKKGGTITFNALEPGTYTVRQVVFGSDGREYPNDYEPVEVT